MLSNIFKALALLCLFLWIVQLVYWFFGPLWYDTPDLITCIEHPKALSFALFVGFLVVDEEIDD